MSEAYYSRSNPITAEQLEEAIRVNGPHAFERAEQAVMRVLERLERTVNALQSASIPYAIVDGHAVAAWVSTIDPGAVRNTVDVDVLLRREDFDAAKQAMQAAGFQYAHVMDIDMFLDGPDGRPRDAVHVLYAEEIVRQGDTIATPSVKQTNRMKGKDIVELESLLRMKLTSFRDKDRVHVRDMIDIGLIDSTWVERLEAPLDQRLQELLDDPFG
jgi:hypothetical protein